MIQLANQEKPVQNESLYECQHCNIHTYSTYCCITQPSTLWCGCVIFHPYRQIK